jgi:autotransporter-associated beta strand protein
MRKWLGRLAPGYGAADSPQIPAVSFAAAPLSVRVDGNGAAAIGQLTGGGTVVKTGSGTLALGSGVPGFAGAIQVSEGAVGRHDRRCDGPRLIPGLPCGCLADEHPDAGGGERHELHHALELAERCLQCGGRACRLPASVSANERSVRLARGRLRPLRDSRLLPEVGDVGQHGALCLPRAGQPGRRRLPAGLRRRPALPPRQPWGHVLADHQRQRHVRLGRFAQRLQRRGLSGWGTRRCSAVADAFRRLPTHRDSDGRRDDRGSVRGRSRFFGPRGRAALGRGARVRSRS